MKNLKTLFVASIVAVTFGSCTDEKKTQADKAVNNFSDAKTSDTALFGKYFKGMLDKGIYLPPSQYESWFLSAALGDSEYDQIISASKATLRSL